MSTSIPAIAIERLAALILDIQRREAESNQQTQKRIEPGNSG